MRPLVSREVVCWGQEAAETYAKPKMRNVKCAAHGVMLCSRGFRDAKSRRIECEAHGTCSVHAVPAMRKAGNVTGFVRLIRPCTLEAASGMRQADYWK